MIKAVLDTNVYVSALGFGGKPLEIIKLALADKFKIVISELIVDETIEICVKKIGLDKIDVTHFMDEVVYFSEFVTPHSKLDAVKNSSDNIILAAALDGNADYLVTGDKKHLLPLKEFQRIKIVAVNDFMANF